MNRTTIEWCQNPDGSEGFTWNPITGCLNGCPYCYARTIANSRVKKNYLANINMAEGVVSTCNLEDIASLRSPKTDPFYPRFWPKNLELDNKNNPGSRKAPIGVFVCNMGDLFGIGVPEAWTRSVLEHIKSSPHHRFYLLTKQPQNLAKFSPFPDNCWVGVSVTDRAMWSKAQGYLLDIEAKVKYYSVEPMLGDIVGQPNASYVSEALKTAGINWLIIGAQTKPTVMPKIEWVDRLISAADEASVPVFLKDSLFNLIIQAAYRGEVDDTYVLEGKLRQDMPKINIP